MSAAAASPASVWLSRTPIDTSATLFFIGKDESALRAELSRRAWHGRVITIPPPAFAGLDRISAPIVPDAEQPVIVIEPAVVRHHREAAKEAARQIGKAWFGARANQEARQRNGDIYRRNTLRNSLAIAREGDVRNLKAAFSGLPALVIGAGPSLDCNLAELASCQDRVVLIAADTALRPLLAAGIEPHLVVEADPSEANARHLCELPPCPNTVLVAEGSVDPESLRAFEGRTFFFRVGDHDPWPFLQERGLECGRLKSWGSVLTTAFDLARVMGCGPIVFAGADLAFTNGRPYARGTTFEESWYQAAAWGQPIESSWSASIESWPVTHETSVSGEPVRTAPHLRSFRDWIATEAAGEPRGSVINGTGGGILVGVNIAQASLGECLSGFEPLSVDIRSQLANYLSRGRRTSPVPASIAAASQESWLSSPGPATEPVPVEPASTVGPGEIELVLESGDLLAQIEHSWGSLGAGHRLHLIDRTGTPDGTLLRRALFAFLETHRTVSARHGRFFNISDDRSWIDRRPVAELNPGQDRSKWLESHALVANRLTPLIIELLRPTSVLDVGAGGGYWQEAMAAHGVTDVEGIEQGLASYCPTRRFDVSLCLGLAHRVPMATAMAAISTCTSASDTIVFSVPAAAIAEPGFINERPWRVWHQEFLDRGFAPCDELRPLVESRHGRYGSSFDLAVVYRRVVEPGARLDERTRQAILHNATRADEQVLSRHWQQRTLAAAAAAPKPRRPSVASVDLSIVPSRMAAAGQGERIYRCRSSAAAAWAVDNAGECHVMEDGAMVAAVAHEGHISFRSTDGTDPRHNGRAYTVRMPSTVAFLESQPLSVIVEEQL